MNKFIRLASLLIVVGFVAVGVALVNVGRVSCHEPETVDDNEDIDNNAQNEPSPQLPVVEFDYKGHLVRVPVYNNETGFSQVRLDFDKRAIRDTVGVAQQLMRNLIIKKRNVVIVGGPTIGKIVALAKKNKAEFKSMSREHRKPSIKVAYGKEMAKMMINILDSKYAGEKLSDEQVYEKVSILLEAVQEVPVHSPTGLYVDWRKLTIDGEPIDVYAEPIVEWFNRSHGRRMCLSGIKMIAAVVAKLD